MSEEEAAAAAVEVSRILRKYMAGLFSPPDGTELAPEVYREVNAIRESSSAARRDSAALALNGIPLKSLLSGSRHGVGEQQVFFLYASRVIDERATTIADWPEDWPELTIAELTEVLTGVSP